MPMWTPPVQERLPIEDGDHDDDHNDDHDDDHDDEDDDDDDDADLRFVKKFTRPDFQGENFTH